MFLTISVIISLHEFLLKVHFTNVEYKMKIELSMVNTALTQLVNVYVSCNVQMYLILLVVQAIKVISILSNFVISFNSHYKNR